MTSELPLDSTEQRKGSGYSKSVDMFSVGAITVMLLTGEALNPVRGSHSITLPPELADPDQWSVIGKRARRFIQQLLVMDEHHRLTVDAALKHGWFTNRHHMAEFESLYERSIKGWLPRHGPVHVFQDLSTGRPETLSGGIHIASPWFEQETPLLCHEIPETPDRVPLSDMNLPTTATATAFETQKLSNHHNNANANANAESTVPSSPAPPNNPDNRHLATTPHKHLTSHPPFQVPLFDKYGRPSILVPPPGREAFYLGSPPHSPRLVGGSGSFAKRGCSVGLSSQSSEEEGRSCKRVKYTGGIGGKGGGDGGGEIFVYADVL